jgi:hypothetical protein
VALRDRWPLGGGRHQALQWLFGHRALDELERAFADCVVRTVEARSLLNALFPRRPSCVNPVV